MCQEKNHSLTSGLCQRGRYRVERGGKSMRSREWASSRRGISESKGGGKKKEWKSAARSTSFRFIVSWGMTFTFEKEEKIKTKECYIS